MHVRAIGALLGLFLALAAGGARAGASGGHGGRSPLPSIRLACQPDLVHAIVPGGAASVATAGVASSAGYNGYWDAPGSPHAWRGRSGGGRGGRMCRWSPKPRLNVDLTFQGINVLEQALANNDTSWEIPGPALCVGNGFAVHAVSSAMRVYSAHTGAPLGPAVSLAAFVGASGARLYNPSCRYDAASRRWFLAAAASAAGITVSVSEGPDPTRAWRHYLLSPPAEPGLALPAFRIPWLAVHPEAVVVSANLLNGTTALGFTFKGAYVYALSKASLVSGALPAVPGCYANASALPHTQPHSDVVPAQQLAPAARQRYGAPAPIHLLATAPKADAAASTLSLFTLRLPPGRNPLATPNALVTLAVQTVALPPKAAYRPPPPADQPSTLVPPRGFTEFNVSAPYRLDALNGRLQSAVAHGPRLYAAWSAAVGHGAAAAAGVAWAVLDVGYAGRARVADAGLLGMQGGSLLAPAIAVASGGRYAAIAVAAVDSAAVWPSAAYVPLSVGTSGLATVGDLVMVARGAGPVDGLTGYVTPDRVGRFGDYGAATVDPASPCSIWVASEMVQQYCTPQQYSATDGVARCGGTRTAANNWGTQISRLRAPGCHWSG